MCTLQSGFPDQHENSLDLERRQPGGVLPACGPRCQSGAGGGSFQQGTPSEARACIDFLSSGFIVPMDQGPSVLQPENSPHSEHVLQPRMGTPPDQPPHPVAQAANLHIILDSLPSSTASSHPLPVCQELSLFQPLGAPESSHPPLSIIPAANCWPGPALTI